MIAQAIQTVNDTTSQVVSAVTTARNNYYKPTPVKWRKIGDAIQDVAIIAAGVAAVFAPPAWIPIAIAAIGRIGKIITNFNND